MQKYCILKLINGKSFTIGIIKNNTVITLTILLCKVYIRPTYNRYRKQGNE